MVRGRPAMWVDPWHSTPALGTERHSDHDPGSKPARDWPRAPERALNHASPSDGPGLLDGGESGAPYERPRHPPASQPRGRKGVGQRDFRPGIALSPRFSQ